MSFATSYEVIRAFPGAGSKNLSPGTILNLQDLNPNNIEGLVRRRYLRPMPAGGKSRAEEQADWLAQLAPYEAIEGSDAAPTGSVLAHLVQSAAATEKTAVAAEKRADTLSAQLAKAEATIAAATERSDFTALAATRTEIEIVGRLRDEAAREAIAVRRLADDAERESSRAWSSVVSARIVLRRMIEIGPIDERDTPRWVRAWGVLRASLDVPQQAA